MSGGQKVKLVLAAAMWNRPHLLVLDEPTNYLDREALGALTQAIKNFHGGVVIISHNAEFTEALCSEQWMVKEGKVEDMIFLYACLFHTYLLIYPSPPPSPPLAL